jgi:pectinesterase
VTDEAGWGAGFKQLVTEQAEVINQAASGRSSKSYIDEGRWTEALAKRGNYYLIQFGHNDEPGKGPERETDPKTTFRTYMSRYVDEARAIGAKPILVTSLVRRIYSEDGTITTRQTPYVEAVRALARAKRVPLVDLHAISKEDAEQTGDDVWADLSPRDDKGQVDRTHLNAKGSDVVARLIVDALREVAPELLPYLRTSGFRLPPSRKALRRTAVAVAEAGQAEASVGVFRLKPEAMKSNLLLVYCCEASEKMQYAVNQ